MADVELSLKTALASVGATVYALQKPLDANYPAVVYTRVNRITHFGHEGEISLYEDHYQLASMAETYAAMRALDEAVAAALTANTQHFVLAVPTGTPFAPPDNRDEKVRMTTRDFNIWSRP